MHVIVKTIRCSKCGSENSERVMTQRKETIRCQGCGHEKIVSETTVHPTRESTFWANCPESESTF